MKKDSLFGLDRVSPHDDDVELLTTVHDNAELSVLRSILEGEEIPYMIKERGSGSSVKIIAGYSMYGTDVFVPKEVLAQATEILEAYRNAEPIEEDGDDDGEYDPDDPDRQP